MDWSRANPASDLGRKLVTRHPSLKLTRYAARQTIQATVSIDGSITINIPSKKSCVIDCSIATMERLDCPHTKSIVTNVF
jgi:hypothetical protein